jgi:effector-binding domain-containing protein
VEVVEVLPLLELVVEEVRVESGHNVMLYWDDVPNVEVGVQVAETFAPSGRVVPSALPAGRIASAIHRGPDDELDGAHRAIREWCAARGHKLTGTRWEIYGDWQENPEELETEVTYLLR